MGITFISGIVKSTGRKEIPVKFLVDSGATYSLLPKNVWKELRLKQRRIMSFYLADGTTVKRGISECYIKLPQGEGHTPVILGEKDDQALLGVVTLEILALVFNPFNRTLQPMKMLMV